MTIDISVGPGFFAEDNFFFSTEFSGSLSEHCRHALNVFLLSSDERDTQNQLSL
jgi:hypothetical protein